MGINWNVNYDRNHAVGLSPDPFFLYILNFLKLFGVKIYLSKMTSSQGTRNLLP